jgi:Fe-S-cluster containining protein
MTGVRRFACTQCGKCCNRSPEVELSEAAALADLFVFRLMFRLYSLPRLPERGEPSELFYQRKRLLAAHAARKYPRKVVRGGKTVEVTSYLMISALTMDTAPGACAALEDNRCTIHERRPLGCRTVPFHYARAEALALPDFDAFVATVGYRCDTGESAPLFVENGRILDTQMLQARADAQALAERDRPWKQAIVSRMRAGGDDALPALQEVEANAGFAAMTTTMRVGWEIAAEAGLLSRETLRTLVGQQLAGIERALSGDAVPDRQTLWEMKSEYQQALKRPAAPIAAG